LIRLAIRCRPEAADEALAALLDLAPNGLEEESGDGWVEYAIYGPPGELPELGEVRAIAGEGLVEVSSIEVPDDWADRWRDFHRAVVVADRLIIRPSWIDAHPAGAESGAEEESPSRRRGQGVLARDEQPAGSCVVVVDPGQAFGTGAHPTTRMCLELLLALVDRGEVGGALTDLGTGSGVLAIAAGKLGWAPVGGFDHERAALAAAAANADANGVELELQRVNLREELPELAPTVVANLTGPLLVEIAGRLREPPRWLVASGILRAEVGQVEAAFAARGLVVSDRRELGDWAALLLVAGRVDRDNRGQLDPRRR
jgi:ribosomal protein L11 methyltransferase